MPGMPASLCVSFLWWRWPARCVGPTHSHSGWIREGNGGRRTTVLSVSGMVHFSPEAEGGLLVTLMDRNAAHPPTHTHTHTHTHAHTCPTHSVSHTLLLAHVQKPVDGYTHTHTITHRLLCPIRSDIQREMFTTRPHGLPPLSINSSQKYVWCIIT